MSNLIERLERAGEGSRELDAAIAVAIEYELPGPMGNARANLRMPRPDDEVTPGCYWLVQLSGMSLRTAPPFSTSLDAAMTLVPEGMGIALHKQWVADVDGPVWWARIFAGGTPDDPARVNESRYDAPTPALALCAAALKAREGQDG